MVVGRVARVQPRDREVCYVVEIEQVRAEDARRRVLVVLVPPQLAAAIDGAAAAEAEPADLGEAHERRALVQQLGGLLVGVEVGTAARLRPTGLVERQERTASFDDERDVGAACQIERPAQVGTARAEEQRVASADGGCRTSDGVGVVRDAVRKGAKVLGLPCAGDA